MLKKAHLFYVALIAIFLSTFTMAITPVHAASTITSVTVTPNQPPTDVRTWCDLPQVNVTITVNGNFTSNDGGNIDALAMKLIDGRDASIWPAGGFVSPRDGGREAFRYFRAPTGGDSVSFRANVYHPSGNPITIEIYEVINFIRNGENSVGELTDLLYTTTYEANCEGAGRPPDGRLDDPLDGPVVVYTPEDKPGVAIEVWRILPGGDGQFAFEVSQEELDAVPFNTNEPSVIYSTEDGIVLAKSPNGNCFITAPKPEGKTYTFEFECPGDDDDNNTTTTTNDSSPSNVSGPPPIGTDVQVVLPPGNRVAIAVYRIVNEQGDVALEVTYDRLREVPENPEQNTLLAETETGDIMVYRLAGGLCQVNGQTTSGLYEYRFECPS